MTIFRHTRKAPLLLAMLAALGSAGAHADDSLYQALGGKAGIEAFSNDFVDNMLNDDRVKHTFDESNIPRIKEKLAEQFGHLAGGPVTYTGHSMTATHKPFHLTNADFNAVVEDLQDAMDKAKVPFFTQNRLLALLAPMQRDIVTK